MRMLLLLLSVRGLLLLLLLLLFLLLLLLLLLIFVLLLQRQQQLRIHLKSRTEGRLSRLRDEHRIGFGRSHLLSRSRRHFMNKHILIQLQKAQTHYRLFF